MQQLKKINIDLVWQSYANMLKHVRVSLSGLRWAKMDKGHTNLNFCKIQDKPIFSQIWCVTLM